MTAARTHTTAALTIRIALSVFIMVLAVTWLPEGRARTVQPRDVIEFAAGLDADSGNMAAAA